MARPKSTEPKKPRKARGPNKAKPEAAQAQPSQDFDGKKPEPEQVRRLVRTLETLSEDQKSIGGTAREKFAKAVESQHFDAKALSWVRSMYRHAKKKPTEFAISLPHCLSYIADLGLDRIADEARGLPINGENDGDGAGEGTESPATAADAPKGSLRVVPKGDADERVPSPQTEVA
jgi:uncharacterized protein (UPF0335 family)